MLKINPISNKSVCCSPALGKCFDPATQQLTDEPKVIIDPKINYRSMSIEVQMENGTLGNKLDFSSFGCNKMDMADRIGSVASEINTKLEEKDKLDKEEEETKKFFEHLANN